MEGKQFRKQTPKTRGTGGYYAKLNQLDRERKILYESLICGIKKKTKLTKLK